MLCGNQSMSQIFCTREIFNAVPSIQESMPKNALEDLTSSLHYSDDWDVMGDEDWLDVYDFQYWSKETKSVSIKVCM